MKLYNKNGTPLKLASLGVGNITLFEEYLETTPVDELKDSWNKLGLHQRIEKVEQQGKTLKITLEDEYGFVDYLEYERK